MFCRKCGSKIAEDSLYCWNCGAKTTLPETAPALVPAKKKQPPKDRATRNAVIILSIMGGVAVLSLLALIAAYFFWMIQLSTATASDVNNSVVVESGDGERGNTSANLLCNGIATKSGDEIYFVKSSLYAYEDFLTVMDLNDSYEQVLLTFYGYISGINVKDHQVFFIGDSYTENDDLADSGIYVYDSDTGATTELYGGSDDINYLYLEGDALYFSVSGEDGDQLLSAGLDGSNVKSVLEKKDTIYSFCVEGGSIYYDYVNTLCRASLSGDKGETIYGSSATLNTYCLAGDIILIADSPARGGTAIKSVSPDGGEEKLAGFSEDERVLYLNANEDKVYFAVAVYNDDDEAISCNIYAMNRDGSDQKLLAATHSEIYGLCLCGKWLFYYDNDKMKTVKINLNKTTANMV